jgi:hypothetical protein
MGNMGGRRIHLSGEILGHEIPDEYARFLCVGDAVLP